MYGRCEIMENKKMMSLFVLCCGALLITGCGTDTDKENKEEDKVKVASTQTLECSYSEKENELTVDELNAVLPVLLNPYIAFICNIFIFSPTFLLHKEKNELVCGLLLRYKEENIESIVTKEQFKSMEYKVGDKENE